MKEKEVAFTIKILKKLIYALWSPEIRQDTRPEATPRGSSRGVGRMAQDVLHEARHTRGCHRTDQPGGV
jgi:hypothetical protein